MEWINEYIGLPFKEFGRDRTGCDCWGLCRILLKDRHGIDVPSYLGQYEGCVDAQGLPKLISAESADWDEVLPDWARPGDIGVFRMRGVAMHTGYIVAKGVMLHVYDGTDTVLESFESRLWNTRLVGVYRHKELCDG